LFLILLNVPPRPSLSPLSLHDALPISLSGRPPVRPSRPGGGSRRSDSFAAHMPLALTPRLLRRGLELFAVISLAGVVGLLFYGRSEEHTSELQSRVDLACHLPLEKKNT